MSCWLIATAGHGCIFRQKITCNFLCYVRFLALLSPLIKEMRNGTQVNFKMTFELNSHRASVCGLISSLFVFQRDDPQKNGVKLLTPVSDLVFNALSDGTIHFALYGSSLNHNLID